MTELSFSEWRRLKDEKSYLGEIRGSLSEWHIWDIYSTSKSVRLAAIWVSLEFMRHPRRKYMLTKEQHIYSVQSKTLDEKWPGERASVEKTVQGWGMEQQRTEMRTNLWRKERRNKHGRATDLWGETPPPPNPRYTQQNTWLLILATAVFSVY